jgi:hypothetical protein
MCLGPVQFMGFFLSQSVSPFKTIIWLLLQLMSRVACPHLLAQVRRIGLLSCSFSLSTLFSWAFRSSASLDVNSWFSRNQSSFFVVLQVLHLDCQVRKEGYAVPPVLFLPLRYVVVLEHVRILSDVLAALRESHSSMWSSVKSLLCFLHRWFMPKWTDVLLAVVAIIMSSIILGTHISSCLGWRLSSGL